MGDPTDPSIAIGPLVAERQRERVLGYIEKGKAEGAKLAVGGGRPADLDKGWFVEPTMFVDVDNKMTIAQEEIFGPVIAVLPYDDPAQAVAIANDSDYGLSGSVWTQDVEAGLDVARQVRTGTYGINQFGTLDMRNPFGGYKASGVGRELGPRGPVGLPRDQVDRAAGGLHPAGLTSRPTRLASLTARGLVRGAGPRQGEGRV